MKTQEMSVTELRKKASELKIKNYARMRREELEKAVIKAANEATEPEKVDFVEEVSFVESEPEKVESVETTEQVEEPKLDENGDIKELIESIVPPAPKKEKSDRVTKSVRYEESKVVDGLKEGSKVKFTTAPNSKVAPKQELEGEVTIVKDCHKSKKEVVYITTEMGGFWKVSTSVTLI